MENSQDNTPSSDTSLVAQLVSYPITAFTLVVAFAWNSAFQSWFAHHPRFKHHGPWVYAISVTVLCMVFVMALYYIQKKATNATSAIKNGTQQKQTTQQTQQTQQKQHKQDSFMLM